MRVLFLHIARQNAPEYGNHRRYARNAGADVSSFFIRQAAMPFAPGSTSVAQDDSGEHYLFELGRNLALRPRPSRVRRALMMAAAMPLSFPAILRTARRLQPDVIYTSQQRQDVQLARLLGQLLGVPHVLALHYPAGPWLGRATLRAIRRSRRLVAISEYVRQTAIAHGADPGVIHVVHNSLEAGPFLEEHDRMAVRRELDIPATAPLISSIGRLDPEKGHAELLEALARIVTTAPDVRLLVCGSTFTRDNYDNYLKNLARQLGLEENVIFAGFRRDIPAIMGASDIFCLPSHNEAFGMVFVEAMAAGLPVVAYRAGGVPEIVVHGETGLLAEREDVDALAAHLQQLLADAELAQRMGIAGRARVLSHFVPRVRAPHWAETVRKLI